MIRDICFEKIERTSFENGLRQFILLSLHLVLRCFPVRIICLMYGDQRHVHTHLSDKNSDMAGCMYSKYCAFFSLQDFC